MVPFFADGPDRPYEVRRRQNREKSKSDDGRVLQSAGDEVRIARSDGVVEAGDFLLNLRADPAHEQVAVLGRDPQNHRGAVLDLAISLRKRRQGDGALPHFVTSSGA
jgi:hypothetical protein